MKKTVAFLILLAPLVWQSGRHLRDETRDARDKRGMSWSQRQRAVYGDWYGVVQQMRSTPPDTRIDVIMAEPNAWGVAVFTATALAPRRCWIFADENAWQRRERAALMHDARAVNAAGPAPPPANIVLVAHENALQVRQ